LIDESTVMLINPPWVNVSQSLPVENRDLLWMDREGSYHLARWQERRVMPVVYGGNAITVEHSFTDYVCWREPVIDQLPLFAIDQRLPEQGTEVVWVGDQGSYHLGVLKGKKVQPAVYGNTDDVFLDLSAFTHWQAIVAPEVAAHQ
jgi:hypothetical protein